MDQSKCDGWWWYKHPLFVLPYIGEAQGFAIPSVGDLDSKSISVWVCTYLYGRAQSTMDDTRTNKLLIIVNKQYQQINNHFHDVHNCQFEGAFTVELA